MRGLLYLAKRENPHKPVLLRDIARGSGAPEAFLSKVFQMLRASNLVRSHRGRQRGYSLARPPEAISLLDVVVATEGPAAVRSPETGFSASLARPFRDVWRQIEEQIADALTKTTLESLLAAEAASSTRDV